jgi:hypothetical protein
MFLVKLSSTEEIMKNFLKWLLNSIASVVFWYYIAFVATVVAVASSEEAYAQVILVSGYLDEPYIFAGYAILAIVSSTAAVCAVWRAASAFFCGDGLLAVPKSQVRIRILWKNQLRWRWEPDYGLQVRQVATKLDAP